MTAPLTRAARHARIVELIRDTPIHSQTELADLLAGDEPPRDIGAWTTTEVPSVTVPAGGQVTVPFTIVVPEDASAGDHVGGIVTSLTVTEATWVSGMSEP